jgi:hypothetical protein
MSIGRKKTLSLAVLAILVAIAPFLYSYQFLLGYKFTFKDHNEPWWFKAYVIAGSAYDAGLITVSSLMTAVQVTEPPTRSPLKTFRLRVEDDSLEALVSNLPKSAKARYYRAWLEYPDGQWRRINYRLRGKSQFHWQIEKPSLRLKLRKNNPIDGLRHINLISPKDRPMLANIVADDLARSMGVLTHVSEMARLFINGRFMGVYQMQTREDEEMLRRNGRLPGPMFYGNALSVPWKKEDFEIVAEDSWLKDISNDPLQKMLDAIEQPLSLARYRMLWSSLDRDNYARWNAASVLAGSLHTDFHHNQLFYFDPGTGKLEFVMNDAAGHGMLNYPSTWRRIVRPFVPDHRSPLNERLHPLLDAALRDPRFQHQRNAALYDVLKGAGSTENQKRLIESYGVRLDADVRADRHKGALQDTFVGIKRMPYSNSQYDEAKSHMLAWVRGRNAFLQGELRKASIRVVVSKRPRNGATIFMIEADGNTATRFDPSSFGGSLRADKALDGAPSEAYSETGLIHPGLREDLKYAYGGTYYVRRNPVHYLMPGVQRYLFAADIPPRRTAQVITDAFTNALTGDAVSTEIEWVDDLDPKDVEYNTVSLHPWLIPVADSGDVIVGPGVVEITDNLIVGPGQRLVIRPGTELRLGPGVSIASHGPVSMVGDAGRPVIVKRLDARRPWGALVIQGRKAGNSRIAFAKISGGSLDTLDNVSYLGMVNVHGADGFRLENSVLDSNTNSDDTLHIVHSEFSISNTTLRDCFGDCIDFDYARGTVENLDISGAGNDGVDFMTSRVTLGKVRIDGAGDKGLSVGEKSYVTATEGSIGRALIGIAVKDRSTLVLGQWRLAENGVGMDVYKKNWRYGGPGRVEMSDSVIEGNTVNLRVAAGGRVQLRNMGIPLATEGDGEIVAVEKVTSAPTFVWRRTAWTASGEWTLQP